MGQQVATPLRGDEEPVTSLLDVTADCELLPLLGAMRNHTPPPHPGDAGASCYPS